MKKEITSSVEQKTPTPHLAEIQIILLALNWKNKKENTKIKGKKILNDEHETLDLSVGKELRPHRLKKKKSQDQP